MSGITSALANRQVTQLLLADTKSQDYAANQFDALQQELEYRAATLQVRPLSRFEDLQLSLDGTVHGYRFSRQAFAQLCSRLSRGLCAAILDIAGVGRVTGTSIDPQLAVQLVNGLIRLRFRDTLLGSQVLLDSATHVIEGLVGQSYRVIKNHDLLQRSHDLLLANKYVFHEASLVGRALSLRYRQKEPSLVLPGKYPDAFYLGIVAYNSETGKSSLRGSPLILRQAGNLYALAPRIQAVRIKHLTGKAALRKLQSFVLRVQQRVPSTLIAMQKLEKLRTVPLGFSEPGQPYIDRKAELQHKMQRVLTAELADMAVDEALARGAYPEPELYGAKQKFDRYKTRTMFDLFCALGRLALQVSPARRESIEAAAYWLLMHHS